MTSSPAPDDRPRIAFNASWPALIKLVLVYSGLHLLYGLLDDAWLSAVAYRVAFTEPAAAMIRLIAPDEPIAVMAHELRSPQLVLAIVRGCDGSGAWFLLTAALLAVGGSCRAVLCGLGLGGLAVYGMNLLRLVALYWIGTRAPQWFDAAHEYVFPGLLVVGVLAFVLVWSTSQAQGSAAAAQGCPPSVPRQDQPEPQQQQG